VLLLETELDVALKTDEVDREEVEREELLVGFDTLLVLLREADEEEEEMMEEEEEEVGTTMLEEELVDGWQPPLQDVYVMVEVVRVVTVTTPLVE
jgi:hypothetical protein